MDGLFSSCATGYWGKNAKNIEKFYKNTKKNCHLNFSNVPDSIFILHVKGIKIIKKFNLSSFTHLKHLKPVLL